MLGSPSNASQTSSQAGHTPPRDRPYLDLTDRQTRFQRAVCVVNAPGKFCVTGTLLMCRGQCCVLFGDQARALVPRDAGQATAVFYGDGSGDATAEAQLKPHMLWCPRAEFGLILCAVDTEPLRAPRVWPLVPSPDAIFTALKAAGGDAKRAPEVQCYCHVDGAAKRSLTLHVDDYDRQADRLYYRFAPPVETHGCPLFHEGKWVGTVTTETEKNKAPIVQGEHRPLYVYRNERGVGVGVVLASLGCAGVPVVSWPPPDEDPDSDSDASSNRPATPPPLNTPFERPRLPEQELRGYAGDAAFDTSARGKAYVGGSGIVLRARRGEGPANRPKGRARHDGPARAIKAVHEANIEALSDLVDGGDPDFLRDLRLAKGWTLAHVAATTGNGAMLVPLSEYGVDLKAATPLGDTVAHTAAYHGCIGALRVLKNKGVTINAENSRGERPVHKALLRRHEACVAWFKRRRCAIPILPRACEEDDGSGFLPRSSVAVAASVHGPRPEVDPAVFLEGFGL